MCGIAGSVNFPLDYGIIQQRMLHRGPDEQQGFRHGQVDFYHLRLSILDIGGGKQPMHLDDRYSIIFNGQIYNHQEIRETLSLQGRTASDTETLLLLYRKLGPAMLEQLDGMFVFALYDRVENTLFLARDRAGKKPLYIYRDAQKLVFASELNCLRGLLPLSIQTENLYHYLRFGSMYKTCTPYRQVSELGAGSYALIRCNPLQYEEHRWWSIAPFYSRPRNETLKECLHHTDQLLQKAVQRRLESSDLEVGSFLSGGIDSGLVTAIASRLHPRLKTYTVSFEGEYDEAPLAAQVARQYGTVHTTIRIAFDHLQDDVEQIVRNYGEPFFDSSAIPSYYVSREARRHLTVILNGDGADELFGGYRRYVPFARYDFFSSHPLVKLGARTARAIMPPAGNKKSTYNYLYRLAALASQSSLRVYLSAGVDIFEGFEQHLLHPPKGYLQRMEEDVETVACSNMSGLRKLMLLDFDINLFNDLLVKMDIASMANSLEGRSPFLSRDILEYAPGIPDQFKIKGRTTKYLLRELAKQYLPAELIHQPKRGFEIPLKKWVDHELKDLIQGYLGADPFAATLVDRHFIRALLNRKARVPAEKRAKMLWTLFCLEVWHRNSQAGL
jgi:asparagine synthase (glutamine-hydrolysing)